MKNPATATPQLRLRIFAGPNGSGKSTIIEAVKNTEVEGRKVDIGYYINADDIAKQLSDNTFTFELFDINPTRKQIQLFASDSGLLSKKFSTDIFSAGILLSKQHLKLRNLKFKDRIAQIIARFLRVEMLRLNRRFSFETVFSHPSNLEIMEEAIEKGYKVYLYFVSTESPEINRYRVALRVKKGGHSVPDDKIESRYYRSINLLQKAIARSYQTFCFDNSRDNEPYRLVAHCKFYGDARVWDEIPVRERAQWFDKNVNLR